jgi:RNA polymerase sigma factor (sigma-70 family)
MLRLVQPDRSYSPETVAVGRAKANPIVFIVDDDADVCQALSDLIKSVGLRTETFTTAADFLKISLPEEASCLILDVRLPGLSGLDFQSELGLAKNNIPIIFITGHGDIPMTVKAMKAGAIDFLTKPFREQDLLDAIRVALDRDRAQREDEKEALDLRARFDALSPREKDVLALVTAGLMNKQVAGEMGVSEVTVKVHRHNLMKKLSAQSLADLVRMADFLRVSRSDDVVHG